MCGCVGALFWFCLGVRGFCCCVFVGVWVCGGLGAVFLGFGVFVGFVVVFGFCLLCCWLVGCVLWLFWWCVGCGLVGVWVCLVLCGLFWLLFLVLCFCLWLLGFCWCVWCFLFGVFFIVVVVLRCGCCDVGLDFICGWVFVGFCVGGGFSGYCFCGVGLLGFLGGFVWGGGWFFGFCFVGVCGLLIWGCGCVCLVCFFLLAWVGVGLLCNFSSLVLVLFWVLGFLYVLLFGVCGVFVV